MYKILKNIIEMDDYSVQKLSKSQPPTPFQWNTVEGTELNVDDCIGGKGKIAVKGNTSQQTYEGKNLLNPNILENGALNNEGEKTNTLFNQRVRSSTKQSISAGTYTISTDEFQIVVYRFNSKNTLYSVDKDQSWKNTPYTFTLDEDGYINIAFKKSDNSNITPSNILAQIEKGSQATNYEPYVGQTSPNPDYPQEIKKVTGDNKIKCTRKNLLPSTVFEFCTINSIGKKITGKSRICSNFIKVKKQQDYTLSSISQFGFLGIAFYDSNKKYIDRTTETNIKSIKVSIPAQCSYVKVFGEYGSGTEQSIIAFKEHKMQLELGTATDYEEYKGKEFELNLGNIELCKIGDYKDVLFTNEVGDENYNAELESGAWYKKGVVTKDVLDGSENWAKNGTNRYSIEIPSKDGDYTLPAYCDKFIKAIDWNMHLATDHSFIIKNINWGENHCRISFIDSDYPELQNWKEFVSENNLTVYRPLKSVEYKKITDPTLISQLEALDKCKWFKGVNHWWTETNNLEPVLKGTYRQAINE